jgi:cbb3-type cytochrome oxidase subunit 3
MDHSRKTLYPQALFLLLLCSVQFLSAQMICELLVRNHRQYSLATIACVLTVIPFALIAAGFVRRPATAFVTLLVIGWTGLLVELTTSRRWMLLKGPSETVFLAGFILILTVCTLFALRPRYRERIRQAAQALAVPLRRLAIRFVFITAAAATAVGLFYTFENWRGQRAWNAWKAKQQAAGKWTESIADLAPPPVPDDQNFAMTPLLKSHLDYDDNIKGVDRYRNPECFERVNRIFYDRLFIQRLVCNWSRAKPTQLAALQVYYRRGTNFPAGTDPVFIDSYLREFDREFNDVIDFPLPEEIGKPAADILAALALHDRELNEISAAVRLPHSRFPVHYHATPPEIVLPHLASLKGLSHVYQLRSIARAANGEQDGSLHDLMTGYFLAAAVSNEPFVMSLLVRNAILEITHGALWEGLRKRTWTNGQLEEIQRHLQEQNLLAQFSVSMTAEANGISVALLELVKSDRDYWLQFEGRDEDREKRRLYLKWAPSGWFAQSAVEATRMIESIENALARSLPLRDLPVSQTPLHEWTQKPSNRNFFAKAISGFAHKYWTKTMRVKTHLNLAITACALERCYSDHQSYPESLDELIPDYLDRIPLDHADNQPLRYKRTEDGRYRIYSVGSNFTDEDGRLDEKFRGDKGDWVWCYTPEFIDSNDSQTRAGR